MRHDALVIGGGLAGATVAGELVRTGCTVVLVEKSTTAQDKVCGDFLSHEALHYLDKMGVSCAALGAVPIRGVRLVRQDIIAEAPLPFPAQSLRRRILDEALLDRTAHAGASVRRGVHVRGLLHRGSAHVARLDGGAELSAESVFLATGKHDLLGHARRRGWHNDLVAFKMYFRLTAGQRDSLADYVELILFPGGYAGLQQVDAGLANLCLLITRRQLRQLGSSWPAVLAHLRRHSAHVVRRLQDAVPALERPLALAAIPYGFLAHAPPAGLWPLGEQAAVIPSFSGDGMSIALHSAHRAADMFLRGEPSAAFTRRMRLDLGPGIAFATGISHLLVRVPAAAGVTHWYPRLLAGLARSTRIPGAALIP